MPKTTAFGPELDSLRAVLEAMEPLDDPQREFVYRTAGQRLGLVASQAAPKSERALGPALSPSASVATDIRSMRAKDFVALKKPDTDVERVAVLGYYLAHAMDTPHFKTIDISRLNTDAAQPPFSNPSKAVANATHQNGFLVPASKGAKQMSAYGERYVRALPDRTRAAEATKEQRRRRRRPRKTAVTPTKKRATRKKSTRRSKK